MHRFSALAKVTGHNGVLNGAAEPDRRRSAQHLHGLGVGGVVAHRVAGDKGVVAQRVEGAACDGGDVERDLLGGGVELEALFGDVVALGVKDADRVGDKLQGLVARVVDGHIGPLGALFGAGDDHGGAHHVYIHLYN